MSDIEIKSSGLKCDNVACDWADTTIEISAMSDWINRPCPKCGENVLTYNDFLNVQTVMAVIEHVNSLPKSDKDQGEIVTCVINTHEKITVSVDKKEE